MESKTTDRGRGRVGRGRAARDRRVPALAGVRREHPGGGEPLQPEPVARRLGQRRRARESRRHLDDRRLDGVARRGDLDVRGVPRAGGAVRDRGEHGGRADAERHGLDDDRRNDHHRSVGERRHDEPPERRRPPRQPAPQPRPRDRSVPDRDLQADGADRCRDEADPGSADPRHRHRRLHAARRDEERPGPDHGAVVGRPDRSDRAVSTWRSRTIRSRRRPGSWCCPSRTPERWRCISCSRRVDR